MQESEKRKRQFTRTLFRWHATHYRDMPWRQTDDPYRILVSEVMLQQTQVDRVRVYYDNFLTQFPDVRALAHAPLREVIRMWAGLGYNRRAKYLHECAKVVVREYDGVFPSTYQELVLLPGIGRSTAGALLAFAFGEETPMIDTNIRRILSRVFFSPTTTPPDRVLYDFAQDLIPKGKGRAWNYAMLDVGATECLARGHKSSCPLAPLHGPVEAAPTRRHPVRFEETARYVRGRIIRALGEGRVREAKMPELVGVEEERVRHALSSLAKDGMLVIRRGWVSLPVD